MSTTLQTSSYLTRQEVPTDPNDPLLSEYGWSEVGKGITRILMGYFIAVVGTAAGVGVLILSMYGHEMGLFAKGNKNTMELIATAGVLLIGVMSLLSYSLILAGKWRCLMNAPERHAARWLIFGCMLCMVIGPVMNILTSLGGDGANNYKQFQHYKEGVHLTFDSVGTIIQLLGTILSLVSTTLFVLFLRAVACCFRSKFLTSIIHLYLLFSALLIGVSAQMIFVMPRVMTRPEVFLGLAAGWLACVLGYVFLVFCTRVCIANGSSRIRSPLAV
jgi:hypothetical protein